MIPYRLGTLVQRNVRLFTNFQRLSTAVNLQGQKVLKLPTGLYASLREKAELLANNEDQATSVFQTLNEIGYTHLNKQAEEGKVHKTDAERFPINTNQTIYMLQLILGSKTLSDPVEAAIKFVKLLVEMNLTKLDDIWLRVLVSKILERNPNKPLDALNAYTTVCESQPYPKVFPGPMFIILMAIKKLRRNEKIFKIGVEVLEKQGSIQPHYVECAVLLANGEALVFLDKLKNADRKLGADELKRLTRLALSIKEPMILEPLVQLYQVLPKDHDACQELFNALAVLYGQRNDIASIEVLWRSLRVQIKGTDWHHYKHVFQRCRHFYRCHNMKPPEELLWVLKKTDDI